MTALFSQWVSRGLLGNEVWEMREEGYLVLQADHKRSKIDFGISVEEWIIRIVHYLGHNWLLEFLDSKDSERGTSVIAGIGLLSWIHSAEGLGREWW